MTLQSELRRPKLIYDVVILIYTIAHVYVYQCACSTVTFVVLGIANLIDISEDPSKTSYYLLPFIYPSH